MSLSSMTMSVATSSLMLMLASMASNVEANIDVNSNSTSTSTSSSSSYSTFTVTLAAATATLTAVCIAALIRPAPSSAPPSLSYLLPLVLGRLRVTKLGPLGLVSHGYAVAGDCFRIRILHKHLTFLIGPKAHEAFFDAKETHLTQKEVYGFSVPVFGDGVVYGADPHIFLQQLKFLSKGLSSNSLASYVPRIVDETDSYFGALPKADNRFDIFNAVSELTINTASRCLLGPEIRNRVQKKFASLYHDLSMGMTPLTFFAPNFPTTAHRKRDSAREQIIEIFTGVLRERKEKMNANTSVSTSTASEDAVPADFLQLLLESKYTSGDNLTDKEISGMLLAALFAGQHTSNITTTWLILSILHSPRRSEIISSLAAERENVLSKSGGALTFDALSEMHFLTACIRETLRMYPPLIFLMRYVKQSITYKNFTIPQGDIVLVSPSVSGRLETVFDRPNEFEPWRFLEGRNEDLRAKYAYIGFGGGRHSCLGERFAMMQIKTILTVLLRDFDMEPIGPLPELDLEALVVGPKLPTFISFTKKL